PGAGASRAGGQSPDPHALRPIYAGRIRPRRPHRSAPGRSHCLPPDVEGMRIIAGQWRGRPLLAPPGDTTRPTADRTRETLFSMLTSRLGSFDGLAVGDFFAGSGALGLE